MNIDRYSQDGKTLMIQHECFRCGKTYLETLETAIKRSSDTYHIPSQIASPPNWEKVGYSTIMCPECMAEYKEFMQAGAKSAIGGAENG